MNKYWLLEMLPQDIQNLNGWDRVQAARSYFEDIGIKFKQPYSHDATRALGHLVVLAYDQLSPNHHLLLNRIARGITLDIRDFSVVSRPFERFFNYGEKDTVRFLKMAQQNGSIIEVVEKVDGSLMRLFYEPSVSKWLLHTRLFYAESPLPLNENMSYSMAFSHALKGEFSEIPRDKLSDVSSPFYQGSMADVYDAFMEINQWAESENLDKDYTYLFELCTPFNETVVKHKGISLYFLGKNKNHPDKTVLLERKDWVSGGDQREYTINTFKNHLLAVKAGLGLQNQTFKNPYICYPLRAVFGTEEAMNILALNENKIGYDHEGHILYIDGIPSIKIKSASYVNLHHNVKNELTFKNAVDCVRMGEYEEILVYHPEAKPMLDAIQYVLTDLIQQTETLFQTFCQQYQLDPHHDLMPVRQMNSEDRKTLFNKIIPKINDKMVNKWINMRLTKIQSVEDCVRKTSEKDFYQYMVEHFRHYEKDYQRDKLCKTEHHQKKPYQRKDGVYCIRKNFPPKTWGKQDYYNLAQFLKNRPEYRPLLASVSNYLRHNTKDDYFKALQKYLNMEDDGMTLCKMLKLSELGMIKSYLMFFG